MQLFLMGTFTYLVINCMGHFYCIILSTKYLVLLLNFGCSSQYFLQLRARDMHNYY